ncbi:MAG: hypothetical protein HRU28_07090, partial [Rhizobiales bacterium]|nr:hypothetical protein [Hyphomicrobiales bacterium]
EEACVFRHVVQSSLDEAGISWEMAVESGDPRAIEVSISADLAIFAGLRGSNQSLWDEIDHGGSLPNLPEFKVNMYVAPEAHAPLAHKLAEVVLSVYCKTHLSIVDNLTSETINVPTEVSNLR